MSTFRPADPDGAQSPATPIIGLAVLLATAASAVVDPALVGRVFTTGPLDHLRAPDEAETFLRLLSAVEAVAWSAVQALVLQQLARDRSQGPVIGFSRSWLWVLVG